MNLNKKGQGLSLNVIIIAALALIVLVVLAVIFTTRSIEFEQKVGQETKTELIKLKISYGDCHPDTPREERFLTEYENAVGADNDAGKEKAKNDLKTDTANCKKTTKDNCIATGYCTLG